jgi:molybdopterin-binding protein
MIRLDGVQVRVGAFDLQDISLEVPTGGYALIIGPTGSGKTTLLDAIAGHVPLLGGRIFLRGVDVTGAPAEQRRIGVVYQQYHLFPHLTVRENIAYGLSRTDATARRRVDELAEMLTITPLLERGVQRLSGGEQQRVALARALAPRPELLLLDEPFAAVDPATRLVLRRELRALHEREPITTLQVTHDFDDALRLGDQVAVLADGRIVQQGPPDTVFRYPNSPYVARFIGTGTVLAGTVTRSGEISPDGNFPAQFTSGPLVLEVVAEREGSAHAVIRPEDLLLSLEALPPSVRNRLRGTIRQIERSGPVALVHVDVGQVLVAAVTAATCADMGLRVGDQVSVALKAMAVHLI